MHRSMVICSLTGISNSMEKLSKRIQASGTTISRGGVEWLMAVAVMLLFVQGCSYPSRIAAVPDNLTTKATVPGLTNVRYWMDGDPKQILVVDDKWDNRSVLVNLLTPLGFKVSEATNGLECLAKSNESPPDLILMDLVMPVMDGFEATRRIWARSTSSRVTTKLGAAAGESNSGKSSISISEP